MQVRLKWASAVNEWRINAKNVQKERLTPRGEPFVLAGTTLPCSEPRRCGISHFDRTGQLHQIPFALQDEHIGTRSNVFSTIVLHNRQFLEVGNFLTLSVIQDTVAEDEELSVNNHFLCKNRAMVVGIDSINAGGYILYASNDLQCV